MTAADVLRTGALGLRTRKARAALSALGIAIGVASMVAVLGISESSKADLLAQIDRLGTNLLRVAPGQSFMGDEAVLPESAAAMLRRVDGVESVAATAAVSGATVRRNQYVDEAETGGITVVAADPALRGAVGATLRRGHVPERRHGALPAVVLGAQAAATLGIDGTGGRVWLGERWFTVIGILDPVTLAEGLDTAALIGFDVGGGAVRRGGQPVDGLRARRPGARRGGARADRADREPAAAGGGRRLAPLRRAGGARGGQDRVHLAVPRAGCGRACSSAASGSPT